MDASLRERLLRIYAETKTIAVVGASGDPAKPAHEIPRYLQQQGYRILPVNPRGGELLGEPVARSLAEVEGPVDVVEVFRPAAEAPQVAREAVKVGAKVLWLQLGIANEEDCQMSLGVTISSPDSERTNYDIEYLVGRIQVALGNLYDRAALDGMLEEAREKVKAWNAQPL